MRHRTLIPLTLVGCACAGCGNSPKGPVARAAELSLQQSSEHVQFAGSVDSPIAQASASGAGDFQNGPDRGTLAVAFRASSTSGSMTVVVADKVLYATSPVFSDDVPGNGWASFKLGKAGKPAGKAFGPLATQTPAGMFRVLRRSHGFTNVGRGTVQGLPATHYRVDAGAGYGPVDVWVGSDGLVAQVASVYTSSSGRTAVTVDFSRPSGAPLIISRSP